MKIFFKYIKDCTFVVAANLNYFYALLFNYLTKNTAGGYGSSHRSNDSSLSHSSGYYSHSKDSGT